MKSQDSVSHYLWFDDTDDLIYSTSATNIGTTTGTVIGDQSSDERFKDNIRPYQSGLDAVLKLQPIAYDRNGVHEIGFGAQTTRPIIPEAVYDTGKQIEGETDTALAMKYVRIIPALVNAIKELSAKVEALECAT
jgi:hypothetical protein